MVASIYNNDFDEDGSNSNNFSEKSKLVIGSVFLFFSIFLFFALVSFFFTGKSDFDLITSEISVLSASEEVKNWLGYFGAFISHYLIFEGFGFASLFFVPLFLFFGFRLFFKDFKYSILNLTIICVFFIFWITILLGFLLIILEENSFLSFYSGRIGYNLALLFQNLFGLATPLILLFSLFVFSIYQFKIHSISLPAFNKNSSDEDESSYTHQEEINQITKEDSYNRDQFEEKEEDSLQQVKEKINAEEIEESNDEELIIEGEKEDLELKVEKNKDPKRLSKIDNYDPKLDLSSYKYPKLESLNA